MKALILVAAGIALFVAMWILVPVLTGGQPGGIAGYFLVLALYWGLFCLPVAAFTMGAEGIRSRLTLATNGAVWVPVLILVQAGAFVAWGLYEGWLDLPAAAIALGVGAAFINAPMEELAWRGAYLSLGRYNFLLQGLGVWLFAAWHFPLGFAQGVEFSISAVEIVVSSLVLGGVWAIAAFATNAVGWPIVGHFVANAVTLPMLIAANTRF